MGLSYLSVKTSTASFLPEDLKASDCERGVPRIPPPLPFVPAPCEQETQVQNVKVEGGLQTKVPIFEGNSAEGHVALMETCAGLPRKKGLK